MAINRSAPRLHPNHKVKATLGTGKLGLKCLIEGVRRRGCFGVPDASSHAQNPPIDVGNPSLLRRQRRIERRFSAAGLIGLRSLGSTLDKFN
jgi:hypothetical protein